MFVKGLSQISSYSSSKILLNTFWQNMTGNKNTTSVQRFFFIGEAAWSRIAWPINFSISPSILLNWFRRTLKFSHVYFFGPMPTQKRWPCEVLYVNGEQINGQRMITIAHIKTAGHVQLQSQLVFIASFHLDNFVLTIHASVP